MSSALLDTPPSADPFELGLADPPRLRASVRRSRLVTTLSRSTAPLVALLAPAGYGKTTLLWEWCAHDPRPFAWVAIDRRHDDQAFLLRAIGRALDGVGGGPLVLVLDDAHLLRSAAARETIAMLAKRPPEGTTVALASRTDHPLPLARLRAHDLVTELRTRELALSRSEAAALLRGTGLQLGRDLLDAVVRRAEGWAALLALAARTLAEEADDARAVARFSGEDRLIAEFVRDEILDGLAPELRRFAVRTSVLDVVTAPLCDELLGRSDSAAALASLQDAGFPLVALDRTGRRFRHHRLLGDALRAELRLEPQVETRLHHRASASHERAGNRAQALHHALAAGEITHAGELVYGGIAGAVAQGSTAVLEHWLTRFTDTQLAEDARLALTAAGLQLAWGAGDVAEHWARAAWCTADTRELAAGVAVLRAALGMDGLTRARQDADAAAALLAPDHPGHAVCMLLRGAAAQLGGAREEARTELGDGARRAAVAAPQLQALCLAQLALLELDEGDPEGASRLAARARSQVARHGLQRYPTSALVLAVAALVGAHDGRVDQPTEDLHAAAALVERLTDVAPWYVAETQLVLGRAALRLSNVNFARARLAEARRRVGRMTDVPELEAWLGAAEADLRDFESVVHAALTPAELRVLQLLPTYQSFRQIGERTRVSANTVKTQANSIYRKLGVRSRSDAVLRARRLGLLEGRGA
jgi:LuxR family maltose regulon positive regulatory protein